MGELEDFKKTLLKKYKEKFVFFQTDGEPLADLKFNTLMWGGDDYKEFLDMAEKVGSKLIYVSEAMAGHDKYKKYGEDIAEIELGFRSDNILHIIPIYASWYNPEDDIVRDEEKEAEDAETLLKKPVNEIVENMISFVDKESKDIGEVVNESVLDQLKRQYWMGCSIDTWSLEPKVKVKVERVENFVDKHFLDIIHKGEDERIDTLATDCVVWCKAQGISSKMYLKKTTVKTFLEGKGIILSSLGIDKLYNKVLLNMRST